MRVIRESADGSLWVGTGFGGLARVRDGRVVATYSTADGLPSNKVNCLWFDRAGTLWVGTDQGLARFDGERAFTTFTTRDGLSDNNINTIFEDREANLWLGTNTGGLMRMKPRKLTAFSRAQGLPGDGVVPVTEDRDGALWIGMTCGGLVHYRDGTFTSYGMKDGLRNDCVWSLLADRQGNVWFGSWGGGLTKFRDGAFTSWHKDNSNLASDAVLALYEDRRGVMWVGTTAGLHRFEHGVFTRYQVRDGLVANDVRFITEDRDGALWIGTTGGVSRFTDGVFTNYTTDQGLAHNYVRAIHQSADGTMWFGTYGGGLVRLHAGHFTNYTARDGLFGNVVSRILEDERGNFWMTGNKGIFRVARQDLDDFADRKHSSITSVPYGVADGMVNSECNGGGQPAGWKRRDGTLWFPTARGVVRIDPASVTSNTVAPRVAIERVLVDRTEVSPHGEIDVPSGGRDLEIFYTGLSYSAPEHVRFKYMLAGLDDGWTDAGTRRSVYYSHLPPGSYSFRVIAGNGDGVWNTTGGHIALNIVPAFYQTWWFVLFLCIAAATLGFAIHDRRVQSLTRAKAAQEAFSRRLIESQEADRKRIAAELHDSLSQTLVVIKNRALLSLQTPDDHRRAIDQMDEIAEAATDAIDEVKEIAYNLRPFHLDRLGLTTAIDVMLGHVADAHGLRIVKDLDPLDDVFPKDEEINVYRIVQEGVTNVVKHAAATEVRVTIKREGRTVAIAIEDDGRGFVGAGGGAAAAATVGKGGFGLQGMAERARLFGGVHRNAVGELRHRANLQRGGNRHGLRRHVCRICGQAVEQTPVQRQRDHAQQHHHRSRWTPARRIPCGIGRLVSRLLSCHRGARWKTSVFIGLKGCGTAPDLTPFDYAAGPRVAPRGAAPFNAAAAGRNRRGTIDQPHPQETPHGQRFTVPEFRARLRFFARAGSKRRVCDAGDRSMGGAHARPARAGKAHPGVAHRPVLAGAKRAHAEHHHSGARGAEDDAVDAAHHERANGRSARGADAKVRRARTGARCSSPARRQAGRRRGPHALVERADAAVRRNCRQRHQGQPERGRLRHHHRRSGQPVTRGQAGSGEDHTRCAQEARQTRSQGHPGEQARFALSRRPMKLFLHAHATHPDWRMALALASAQLQAQHARDDHIDTATLGWVYLSDHYAAHAEHLLDELRAQWPGVAWVGSVGVGIAANGVEYFDEPALSLMLGDIAPEHFRVFSGVQPLSAPPLFAAVAAQVHADPAAHDAADLISELAGQTRSGPLYLFGGLASARNRSLHIADGVFSRRSVWRGL